MVYLLMKATGIWFMIVVVAILNGLLRENILTPTVGSTISLPLSGVILSLLIFLITYFLISFVGKNNGKIFLLIGLLWVVLTLAFEYLFGSFILGKSWTEISNVFNLRAGNLFTLVVFTSAIAPWLAAKMNNICE